MDQVEALEAMFESSEDGLLILGSGGEVLRVNGAAERLSGLGPELLLGRRADALDGESDFPWSIAAEVLERRTPVSLLHARARGGTLLVSARMLCGPAGLPYLVLTLRDVTEMDRLMASLEESRSLSERYRRELRTARARERHSATVVAEGPSIRAAWQLALKYSTIDSPVLLLGETGSGKGVFSRLIHQASARAAGPFIEVNCGAIPEGLMEAELFGYVRGAFTGADARGKPGLVELAHTGTVLLDEIGDLPLPLQVKLLRFLEEGEIWPVGAVRSRRPDVRILAATNHDLDALMGRGAFRRDLFYRLNVLMLRVPPLRERREDIPGLVGMMLARLAGRVGRQLTVTPAALAMIARYDFPGNVRELWNLVERLAVTVSSDAIDLDDLPAELTPAPRPAVGPPERRSLRRALQEVEADIVRQALARHGTQAEAAAYLGVSQATVARRAKRYGLRG
jgi:PAS domain S-box-containing protein